MDSTYKQYLMITKAFTRSFSTAASTSRLFTWGETTYGWGRELNGDLRVPGQVGNFGNVTKVATGRYHLLFLTDKNQVFSTGLHSNGRLGQQGAGEEPREVANIQSAGITQLAAGCRHSLALSEKGDVFAWGYGGRTASWTQYLPFLRVESPLGLGDTGDVQSPQLVQNLKEEITQIAAGSDLSLAVGASGKVYGWGQGLYALHENPTSTPSELSQVNYFLDSHHAHVKKVRSTGCNAFFLLDDGRLYVLGNNNAGVFATRKNPKVVLDNVAQGLTKIIDEDLHNEKVTDFQVSANSLIFTTDAGRVFYSGMHRAFRPEPFPVERGSVKSIFATYDSVGVIDTNGRVGYLNDAFIQDSDKKGDIFVVNDQNLRNVSEIGGTYKLRYALVQ